MNHEKINWETLAAFAEQRVTPAEAGAVYAHLKECKRCRDVLKELCGWLVQSRKIDDSSMDPALKAAVERIMAHGAQPLTHEEILRLRWQWVVSRLRVHAEVLAAADGQTADQRQQENALCTGRIHFTACVAKTDPHYWHASLAIPPHPTEKTILRILVETADGKPVLGGKLILCGVGLELDANGRAVLPIRNLRENLSKNMVELQRADGSQTPGEPHIGYTEETELRN